MTSPEKTFHPKGSSSVPAKLIDEMAGSYRHLKINNSARRDTTSPEKTFHPKGSSGVPAKLIDEMAGSYRHLKINNSTRRDTTSPEKTFHPKGSSSISVRLMDEIDGRIGCHAYTATDISNSKRWRNHTNLSHIPFPIFFFFFFFSPYPFLIHKPDGAILMIGYIEQRDPELLLAYLFCFSIHHSLRQKHWDAWGFP